MIGLVEVGVGGLVGAPARFMVDQLVSSRSKGVFPWGTYIINVTGAFVLGLISGLALYQGVGHVPSTVIGTGFCGAYTTFSTFSWETVRLFEEGTPGAAAWNVAGSLVVGLLGAAAGLALGYVV
ncbi:MAG: fluoride efflux transporter CrcB [Actinomycetota bacterium]|nr:fluoride efflux transporter CrcB [Actinomycetota bacterium]